jgi:hypothetical protein
MGYRFPLDVSRALVQRVEAVPAGAVHRRWVIRDDNQQHHHGIVRLSENPLYVELWWKANARGREQQVGTYRLDLAALVARGYIRYEPEGVPGDTVRLRFVRGERGVVSIQSRADGPALAVGTVDLAG